MGEAGSRSPKDMSRRIKELGNKLQVAHCHIHLNRKALLDSNEAE